MLLVMDGRWGGHREGHLWWWSCQCFVQLCVCYQCSHQGSLSLWVAFSPALSLVSESVIWSAVQLLCHLQGIPSNIFKFSAPFLSLILPEVAPTWEMLHWFFWAGYKSIFKACCLYHAADAKEWMECRCFKWRFKLGNMATIMNFEWNAGDLNGDPNISVMSSSPAPHSSFFQLISGCLLSQPPASQVGFISKMMTVIWFSLSLYFHFSKSRAS